MMTRTELVRRRRQMHRRIRQIVAERRLSMAVVVRPAAGSTTEQPTADQAECG